MRIPGAGLSGDLWDRHGATVRHRPPSHRQSRAEPARHRIAGGPPTSPEQAVEGADIITTCTADKQYATILTDNLVGAGVHINAVGGDCPGKTELHVDILHRSDIFVEYPEQTRIEGEIQQLAPDHPVTELWQVMTGQTTGRRDNWQITLFDSVGFAIEDFSALRYIKDQLQDTDNTLQLDLLADPDDPRDLFGMLQRARPDAAA